MISLDYDNAPLNKRLKIMTKILVATCDDYVKLDQSDALFQAALIEAGVTVTVLPWRHASFWNAAADNDAVVIRSVWDYPAHLTEFKNWLAELAQRNIRVFNSPQLLKWNLNKHYLFELKRNGVRVPRTVSVKSADDLVEAFEAIQDDVGVLKPCFGGSGREVEKVDLARAQLFLSQKSSKHPGFLLQEMLPEISKGELSFVFIGGVHTHTVRSQPAKGEFRVNSLYGPSSISLFAAPANYVEQASSVVNVLPYSPTYARIDCVARDNQLICLEVETIDPTLFMNLFPEAAETLAEAVLSEII